MPIGAHELLSFLAEPLKQLSENPDTLEDNVSENLKEFQDWVCFILYVYYVSFQFWIVIVPDGCTSVYLYVLIT